MKLDKEYFSELCEAFRTGKREAGGIGTLGEHTLHAVLKQYIEPDPAFHEQKVGRFVADIRRGDDIFEIQTRNFGRLREKIEGYPPECHLHIIYPIAVNKYLMKINPETGEVSKPRLSPRHGTAQDLLPELYLIRKLLPSEKITFHLFLMETEEHFTDNGRRERYLRERKRVETLPRALYDILSLHTVEDFSLLLPDGLGENFSAVDYRKRSHLSVKDASFALGALRSLGVVRQTGKRGNAYLYSLADPQAVTAKENHQK